LALTGIAAQSGELAQRSTSQVAVVRDPLTCAPIARGEQQGESDSEEEPDPWRPHGARSSETVHDALPDSSVATSQVAPRPSRPRHARSCPLQSRTYGGPATARRAATDVNRSRGTTNGHRFAGEHKVGRRMKMAE
jgi:hypothetical protein